MSDANKRLKDLGAHFESNEDEEKVAPLIASMIVEAESLKRKRGEVKKDLMACGEVVDELTNKIEYSKASKKAL